jgi:3-oxoadipate CoA-transferase beta subunit
MTFTPQGRAAIAARVADDIPEGWYVNLGVGIPTMVADYIGDREVLIHSENGILGMGPRPVPALIDPWLVNAGKQYVTLLPGASLTDQATSFAMIRGGHLDLCVLGAFEVAANGDLANWALSASERVPAVGGAMDLSVGAKRIWVITDHNRKDGAPKIVERCQYPLTAQGVVTRVYTDLAVMDVTKTGLRVIFMVPGLDFATLQSRTGAVLLPPVDLAVRS